VPALGERLIALARIADGEHGTWCVTHDAFGDAAEDRVKTTDPTMRTHHDQIEAVPRDFDDAAHRIAVHGSSRRAVTETGPRLCERRLDRALGLRANALHDDLAGRHDIEHHDRSSKVLGKGECMLERGERWRRTVDRD